MEDKKNLDPAENKISGKNGDGGEDVIFCGSEKDGGIENSKPAGTVKYSCDDAGKKGADLSPKTFIEILPSNGGTILAALLANVMAEGLSADQQNILGNFISAVGSLISYKASRDELNNENNENARRG